ncbi:hypothetical protein CS006_09055 [Bifidobacterium primatium]|uniref:DUF3043 domain-containing protein n=2 Tax=Bifidobacterium TaxID=1678 RepID=A0A2M9H7B4_9BIFI|nr:MULTISPECIES: DUF3043 domain-containing protein [Bifidobacterium]NEG95692.1 DUF3043 domain-containing protein [Bifidobacterium sp. SMB2]NEH11119.1 DUF3043 domain-containing protein [Bifidobacterium saimiriisciurei]PJM72699.1 hypothetical protein CS006_09055 [Bifidobacterium primatium]
MTWNPFKRSEDKEKSEESPAAAETKPNNGKKNRPTPKMKDAQAAKIRPLVPKDRKASNKVAKAKLREKQDSEYAAMKSGDLAHMPKSERIDYRIYIRDYVDARWNLAEFMMPFVIIMLVASMFITSTNPQITWLLMLVMYAYFFAAIIDIAIMWHGLKKKLIAKYGEKSVAKGTRSASYAWSRSMQMRRWRLPRPRNQKRGVWPE